MLKEIFNNTIANELQVVTFILEILGVTLAFIEIKFPLTADRIEAKIRSSEDRVRTLGERITNDRLTEYTMTAFIMVFFFAMFDWWGFWNLPGFIWILFGVIFLAVSIIFGLYLIEGVISFLNSSSNGRALGALGVALAVLGLVGELYQMIFMVVSDDNTSSLQAVQNFCFT